MDDLSIGLRGRLGDIGRAVRAAEAFAREDPAVVAEDEFPSEAFARLHAAGLMAVVLPAGEGGLGLGIDRGTTTALLRILAHIGRYDLSVGRVYEGHCNALQLIALYGTSAQRAVACADAAAGRLFGVWNTEEAASAVRIEAAPAGGRRLRGAKIFCSGAGCVTRPIVTARDDTGGVQMCLLAADRTTVSVDLSGWRPLGMAASLSGRVGVDGVAIEAADLLGEADDYRREPWFLGGAARFAAVHLGGAESALRIAVRHLRATGRGEDPSQIARIGTLAIAVDAGRARLERTARFLDRCLGVGSRPDPALARRAVHQAQMMRLAIERICLDALELATRSVGVAGLLRPHPLERLVRDLATYLRQPAPDAALAAIGRFVLTDPDDE
jgi:alkylation response protein AidB-like acyl-CoA dehydrogenase